jgi:hypothetical protein
MLGPRSSHVPSSLQFMLRCMSLLLAQSGHERLRNVAVRITFEPHFAGRKRLV